MRPFTYLRPESIAETVGLLGDGTDDAQSRILAGGTDLLTLMKGGIAEPARLIDIKRLPDLNGGIALDDDGGLSIGALATLSDIEAHPLITERYPALAQSVAVAATAQIRTMATIGGNLLQRSRCWYFRDETNPCWLKGGDTCPARDGENQHHAILGSSPCVSVHPSDPANALLALDAEVTVHGADGVRRIGLAEVFQEPTDAHRQETRLRPDDVVVALHLPVPSPGARSAYQKAMDRHAWSFALVSVAASLTVEDGTIADARLVLGGVATIPWRVPAAEQHLMGTAPSPDRFAEAAEIALHDASPLAKNAYKVPLLRSLIPRALEEATR
jgi:xanthine dehydrogenase YagS FAD-binding subunit